MQSARSDRSTGARSAGERGAPGRLARTSSSAPPSRSQARGGAARWGRAPARASRQGPATMMWAMSATAMQWASEAPVSCVFKRAAVSPTRVTPIQAAR